MRISVLRWALFIPLLLGLLFSAGEGITLLPFPDMPVRSNASVVRPSSPTGDERIDIDKNTRSIQAKLPVRDMAQHAGSCDAANLFANSAYDSESGSARSYECPVTVTTAFPASLSGRAPPVSES